MQFVPLHPGLCFGIAFSLNTIAIFYHSLAAVPFGTMVRGCTS
jgi:transmembrane 9 superfamily protein 3